MVWAWMLWSAYDLGTRTGFWFGNGCSGNRAHSKMNGIMVWDGCFCHRIIPEHEPDSGLGIDARVIALIQR